jgi:hypothetical protein
MAVLLARPPNWDAVAARFPDVAKAGAGIIFTHGRTIYNPNGVKIEPWLRAHEGVHSSRQGPNEATVARWWERYLEDVEFRLCEEIPAHRAEFKCYRDLGRKNNWDLGHALHLCAERLSGALYGNLISYANARTAIAE